LVPQQGGYLSGELRSDYVNNYRIRHPNGSTFSTKGRVASQPPSASPDAVFNK
jgi:hypothetical protein